MWLIPTILAFACVIAVHATLRRVAPAGNSVVQFLGVAVLGAGALAMILPLTAASGLECLTALSLLTFCCELYLFLFTFAISSVSIAMLLAHTGRAPRPETGEPTGEAPAPAGRVRRRLESRLLVRTSAGYALTSSGRAIVRVCQRLRDFFRHES